MLGLLQETVFFVRLINIPKAAELRQTNSDFCLTNPDPGIVRSNSDSENSRKFVLVLSIFVYL